MLVLSGVYVWKAIKRLYWSTRASIKRQRKNEADDAKTGFTA
jgi:hypothetical protein